MESRNVKVIDEHGIDRDAYVICGLNLDASDYVLYSIERDGDNDNLFVSKIIKNIDGTSNMINIEDSMEKSKINEVVKELITYSVKNEADKTTGKVTLADGKEVTISGVLFNKEQNINVGKTYITTVKKAVTKVSEDYYKTEEVKKEENSPVLEAVPKVVEEPKVETPEQPVMEEPKVEEPVQAPVLEEVVPESVEVPAVEPAAQEMPVVEEPKVVEPEVTPVLPAAPVMQEPVIEPILPVTETVPVMEEVKEEPVPVAPLLQPEVKPVQEPKVEPIPAVTPIIPVSPIPAVEPVAPVPVEMPVSAVEKFKEEPVTSEPKLFFDGSQETNLNQALDEVNIQKMLPTQEENVDSLREFGADAPVAAETSDVAVTETTGKVLKKSKGFANNKFFVVIAIAFFLAACVFLGYEAFQYFKLIK